MTSLDESSVGTAPVDAVQLENFIGEWRDSMGHQVRVRWAQQGNAAGELDVVLLRPFSSSRNQIRLNIKALDQGKFQCGHFELELGKSSAEKIVWGDMRKKGKVSVWEREEPGARSRSRSRSPSQRRRNCGCVFIGKVALRCIDHLPPLPPRSVLHDISTPGAWAPPDKVAEIVERPSEADRLLEAYDESLTQAATAEELPQPEAPSDVLDEAKTTLLGKHFQTPDVGEAKAPELAHAATAAELPLSQASPDVLDEAKAKLLVKLEVPDMPSAPTPKKSKDRARDPRLRRSGVVAPTGGA